MTPNTALRLHPNRMIMRKTVTLISLVCATSTCLAKDQVAVEECSDKIVAPVQALLNHVLSEDFEAP